MDEQGSQVDVALLGDLAEMASVAGAVLAGGQAEPAAEVLAVGKAIWCADGGDQRGAGQKPDAGDGLQALDIGIGFGQGLELVLDPHQVGLEGCDLIEHAGEDDLEWRWNGRLVDEVSGLLLGDLGPERHGEAEFAEEAAQAVDALSAGVLPLLTDTVELLEHLLLDRADGDGLDVVAAMGFEQGIGIGAVGFATTAIGRGVLGGEQADLVSEGLGGAPPEVGGAAGLEQDEGRRLSSKEGREGLAGKPVTLEDTVMLIGGSDFEDILCQVDGDDFRLHEWTPSVA